MKEISNRLGKEWRGGLLVNQGNILRKIDEPNIWVIPSRRLFIWKWLIPVIFSWNHPVKEVPLFWKPGKYDHQTRNLAALTSPNPLSSAPHLLLIPHSAFLIPRSAPPVFGTFLGFFPRSQKYMVNIILMKIKALKSVSHYFVDVRVFLKTAGSRKGKMSSDRQFKRKTYQALDTGDLSYWSRGVFSWVMFRSPSRLVRSDPTIFFEPRVALSSPSF